MEFLMEDELKWGQPNILWASLTMALLTLPVVIVSVEEAIRTIPKEMREASLALGATKWQTIEKVVTARICFRHSYRNNTCSKQGSRRSGTYPFYGGCLFSVRSASFTQRPVHVARISYLYHVDSVIKC